MNFKNNPCEKHLDVSIDAHAGFCPICLFNERDAAIVRAEKAAADGAALREASKSAIEALIEAQGEWASVERWHAPEWTHPLKQAIDELEAALKGGEE